MPMAEFTITIWRYAYLIDTYYFFNLSKSWYVVSDE
jgi:hypothetical protein